MNAKPFNGNGIPVNLDESSSKLYNDEYYQLIKQILSKKNLLNNSREETKKLQKSLLYPYLEFFIRNDQNEFYKNLFFNRGIAKDQNGTLKDNLDLIDLVKLRVHSDDLRADGQEIRLIHQDKNKESGMNFISSGTTVGTNGPVNVFRSNLSLSLSRLTNGNLIDWSLGKTVNEGSTLFHMAPEMTNFLAFAAIGSDFLRERGLGIKFGAKVNKGPKDSTIWQRLGPDIKQMKSFFKDQNSTKYFIASGVGLYKMFMEPKGIKKFMMKLALSAPPVYLGEKGVLMIGGGLKRLPSSITSLNQVVQSTGDFILAGNNKNSPPAPVIDMLGLTESLNVFIGVPTSPFSNEPWIKFPHPLTYTALLKSPFDLTPVENPKEGEEYLLFYVNLMTLDYVEAIIPGDFVKATKDMDSIDTVLGKRNIAQNGFVYSRRAEQNEGFKIREGCG